MDKTILTILTIVLLLPIISVSTLAVEPYIYEYGLNIWFGDGGSEIGSYNNIFLSDSGNTYSLPIGTDTTYETIFVYAYDTKFSGSCSEAEDRIRISRERYFYEEDLDYTKSPYSQTLYPSNNNDLGSGECQIIFPTSGTFNGNDYNIADDLTSPTTGDSFIEGNDRLDIVYYVQVLQ